MTEARNGRDVRVLVRPETERDLERVREHIARTTGTPPYDSEVFRLALRRVSRELDMIAA